MQCEFFTILVDELATGREANTGLAHRLLNHAGECQECGIRLSQAQALTEILRMTAAADAQVQAPDRNEAVLLEYFRERRQRRLLARPWKPTWVAAAACACLVAIALAVWASRTPQSAHKTQPAITAPEMPPASRNPGRVEVAERAAPAAAGRTMIGADSADYSGFIPLEDGESLPGSGQIVHVEVSRSALASMGFPVTEAASGSPVAADILIGEDGMATAIRFDSR